MMWDNITSSKSSLQEVFIPLFLKINKYPFPVSVAELKLSMEEVDWLVDWFKNLSSDSKKWLTSGLNININLEHEFSEKEMFGSVLIILASELGRDCLKERLLWPAVSGKMPEENGIRNYYFPGGQPSVGCKEAIADGVNRLKLRNVLTFDGAQEYYDTIKLQFGFTFVGARKRLPYWLVGLGTPLAIRQLCGENSDTNLKSDSFLKMWKGLKDFNQRKINEEEMRSTLTESPWVKTSWIEELITSAKKYYNPKISLDDLDEEANPEDIVSEFKIYWPIGKTPRIRLVISEASLNLILQGVICSSVAFEIDGKKVGRWIRQPDNSWHGKKEIYCEPEALSTRPNLAPNLLRIFADDMVVGDVDLSDVGLSQDLIIFDVAADSVKKNDSRLNTKKEYLILCDSDLKIQNVNNAESLKVNKKNIYRLKPNWPENLSINLSEQIFWEPQISSMKVSKPLKLTVESLDDLPVKIGGKTYLTVGGIPDEAIKVFLINRSKKIPLRKENGTWRTIEQVEIYFYLAINRERLRVQIENRIYIPVFKVPITGLVLIDSMDQIESEYGWFLQNYEDSFDVANGDVYGKIYSGGLGKKIKLYEGSRPVGEIKKGILKSDLLSGWGQQLAVKDVDKIVFSKSVEDKGLINYYYPSFGGQPARIVLRKPIDTNDYKIIYLTMIDKKAKVNFQDEILKIDDLSWSFKDEKEPLAIGLSFNGIRMGAWWDIEKIKYSFYENSTVEYFALMRWFKIPLLSENFRHEFGKAVYHRPLDFIRAWCFEKGLTDGLQHRQDEKAKDTIIRFFMWDWMPFDEWKVNEIVKLFQGKGVLNPILKSLLYFADVCPPLMMRMLSKLPIQEKDKFIKELNFRILDVPNELTEQGLLFKMEYLMKDLTKTYGFGKRPIIEGAKKEVDSTVKAKTIRTSSYDVLRDFAEIEIGRKYLSCVFLRLMQKKDLGVSV